MCLMHINGSSMRINGNGYISCSYCVHVLSEIMNTVHKSQDLTRRNITRSANHIWLFQCLINDDDTNIDV